jgi:hypothetical protein
MAGDFLKLNRHGTQFYFRRRVPDDLRQAIGQRYLVQSLRTGLRSVAVPTARLLAAKSDLLFDQLRTMSDSSHKSLEVLVLEWKLKHALNEAQERFEELLAEQQAKHGHELEVLRFKAREVALKAHILGGKKSAGKPPCLPGLPFSEAMEAYLALQKKGTTRRTYSSRLKHSLAYFGLDKDVRHIEQADLSAYATHAKNNIGNVDTAGLCITTLCGMLNYFRGTKGWGADLTTKRLVEKKETPDSEERDAFTLGQVRLIFENAKKYRSKAPHKYWATIAVQFLGCRIEELAQINLHTDLIWNQVAGIWYFDLNGKVEADGSKQRSLKNKQSWRRVPIHSALVRHGFVEYLIEQRNRGFSRPFESGWGAYVPKNDPEPKWSHYITNWGGRELAKLRKREGFATGEQVLGYFHSMRHTFSGCMGRADISAEISEAVVGHAYAGAERMRYQKLKQDEEQLSVKGIEPGLVEIAALLDALW